MELFVLIHDFSVGNGLVSAIYTIYTFGNAGTVVTFITVGNFVLSVLQCGRAVVGMDLVKSFSCL